MARASSKIELLNDKNFVNAVSEIYGGRVEEACERYSRLSGNLSGDCFFFSSPGRAELVGNHTDHNGGLVLATTIDLDIAAAAVKNGTDVITVNSEGYSPFSVRCVKMNPDEKEYGTSAALLKGVVNGFLDRGFKVGGFDMNVSSTVFKGAGVSSSAAFELLFCEAFNVLFNDGKIDATTKAIISQYAENVFFGKPSGLMDQLTIAHGGVNLMNFSTAKSVPSVKTVPWNFNGVKPVIINCGGDHCNLTGEYGEIRKDMEDIASYFKQSVLGNVNPDDFAGALADLQKNFSGRAILRSAHFFKECKRVIAAADAVSCGDSEKFFAAVNESGLSSYQLLQNCYAAHDKEQSVPLALFIAGETAGCAAKRVHGGGFAGTILCFVSEDKIENFMDTMSKHFGKENVFCFSIRQKGACYVGGGKC